jgi:hypothetical protein
MGLAAPILAAVAVGISVVVITGGGGAGGSPPSALDAGFPPARLAVTDFGGATAESRVVLAAVAASAATEVVTGSAAGVPAIWVSADGGSSWGRVKVTGPAAAAGTRNGTLSGVARGKAGWLAVGRAQAAAGGSVPLVIGSRDARSWTAAAGTGTAGLGAAGTSATAVAAGPAGYVIVGRSDATARAWSAAGLTGWREATVASAAGAVLNAVTVTAAGFAAVGATGNGPAAWLSATGRDWQLVNVPAPGGASMAALDFVAAAGRNVVAVGTALTADGRGAPFADVSADAGSTWTLAALPSPAQASAAPVAGSVTVTALTAAGGGFTATGTFGVPGGAAVVVWTLPASALPASAWAGAGAPAPAWTAVAPQGTGLAAPGTDNAITALTAVGATLTGVGFTTAVTASGGYGAQRPTLWQSPIRP